MKLRLISVLFVFVSCDIGGSQDNNGNSRAVSQGAPNLSSVSAEDITNPFLQAHYSACGSEDSLFKFEESCSLYSSDLKEKCENQIKSSCQQIVACIHLGLSQILNTENNPLLKNSLKQVYTEQNLKSFLNDNDLANRYRDLKLECEESIQASWEFHAELDSADE